MGELGVTWGTGGFRSGEEGMHEWLLFQVCLCVWLWSCPQDVACSGPSRLSIRPTNIYVAGSGPSGGREMAMNLALGVLVF